MKNVMIYVPYNLRKFLNSQNIQNFIKESPNFEFIRTLLFDADTFPIEFLRGIKFLLEVNTREAEIQFSRAFEKKTSLPVGISQKLKSTISLDINLQSESIDDIIQEQKMRFKKRNRLDELLRAYHVLSLEKMAEMMEFEDTNRLEKFLIELPEQVPVKILGGKVYLGRHDFTGTMIEEMNKALEGWERSGFGAYSSTVFSCQIDGGTHPLREAHYQCVSCHRFVCETCYTSLKEVGRIICPFCESSLRFIASQ